MKKIILGHLLLIVTLFLWRADHKAVKPPLKVTTHTIVKPQPKPIVATQSTTQPEPKPVVVAPTPVKPKAPPKQVVKKQAPPATKQEKPSHAKLMALMEESLTQLDSSKPSKNQSPSKASSIGPLKSETMRYTEQLISALQTMLTFPETQDVLVKLKLSRAGKILSCDVLESRSLANKEYVAAVIPTLQLPPFDGELKGASTHTFSIRLIAEKTN